MISLYSIWLLLCFVVLSREDISTIESTEEEPESYSSFYQLIKIAMNATGEKGFTLVAESEATVESFIPVLNSGNVSVEVRIRSIGSNRVVAFVGYRGEDLMRLLEGQDCDPSAFFLVMSNSSQEAEDIVERLWSQKRVYYGFSAVGDEVYTYDLVTGAPATLAPDEGLWKRVRDWQGKSFNAVVFQRAHSMVEDNRTELGYGGDDAEVLDTLCTKLNLSCHLSSTPDGKRYGFRTEQGQYAGTLASLVKHPGGAEMAANGHFQKWYSSPAIEFTHYVTAERLCVLVSFHHHLPHSEIVLKTLSDLLSVGLVTSYVLVGLSILAARKLLLSTKRTDVGAVVLDLCRLQLALPVSTAGRTRPENISLTSFFLASFFLVNQFQGALVTFINAPLRYKSVDTIDELAVSGIPIWYSSRDMYSLLAGSKTLSRLNLVLKTEAEMIDARKRTDIGRLTRLNVAFDPSYTEYVGLKANQSQRVVKECLATYFIAYLVPKGSPYAREIDRIVSDLVASGLYSRWLRGQGLRFPPSTDEQVQFRELQRPIDTIVAGDTAPLNIKDLWLCFRLLKYGSAAAFVVLLLEISTNRWRKRGNAFRPCLRKRSNRPEFNP